MYYNLWQGVFKNLFGFGVTSLISLFKLAALPLRAALVICGFVLSALAGVFLRPLARGLKNILFPPPAPKCYQKIGQKIGKPAISGVPLHEAALSVPSADKVVYGFKSFESRQELLRKKIQHEQAFSRKFASDVVQLV